MYFSLQKLPGTVLYYLDEDDEAYDPDNNEYYFDRNPVIFSALLDYYRTGNSSVNRQSSLLFDGKELKQQVRHIISIDINCTAGSVHRYTRINREWD